MPRKCRLNELSTLLPFLHRKDENTNETTPEPTSNVTEPTVETSFVSEPASAETVADESGSVSDVDRDMERAAMDDLRVTSDAEFRDEVLAGIPAGKPVEAPITAAPPPDQHPEESAVTEPATKTEDVQAQPNASYSEDSKTMADKPWANTKGPDTVSDEEKAKVMEAISGNGKPPKRAKTSGATTRKTTAAFVPLLLRPPLRMLSPDDIDEKTLLPKAVNE